VADAGRRRLTGEPPSGSGPRAARGWSTSPCSTRSSGARSRPRGRRDARCRSTRASAIPTSTCCRPIRCCSVHCWKTRAGPESGSSCCTWPTPTSARPRS
jgi:hypothetical protein